MDEQQLADRFIKHAPDVTETDSEFVQPETPPGNSGENGDSQTPIQSPRPKTESPRVDTRRTDSAGNYFDPEIHLFDEKTGNPVLTMTGKFRKRPGRKSAGASSDPNAAAKRMSCREAGRVSAEAVFLTGQTLFGEEWKPVIDNEHGINEPEQMTTAFAAYYEATGFRDPPPWLVLVIGLGAYAGPRLAAPKTKSKLKRFGEWLGLHAMGWRKKKTKQKESE